MDELYLKRGIQIEPLVDQWYAWSHLLSPATAARNVTERHLRIMDSYIQAPEVHAAAVKNPRMLGGPFIDYGGGRVEEIRALKQQTISQRQSQVELSEALAQLNTLVQNEARGYSLQSLYSKVPSALRGYVELVYDLNNQPSYRLIEPLLFRSRFHDTSLQSVMLSPTAGDDRPFALSTPRLGTSESLVVHTPFSDPSLDGLFRLSRKASTRQQIASLLARWGCEEQLMSRYFGPEPPRQYEPYDGRGARWRYFGHACILVETPLVNVLVDPVISYTYETDIPRYTYEDLPDIIDYVLITHNHQDHILFETLLQLRHKVRHIVVPKGGGSLQDPSLKWILLNAGFQNVIELSEMEEMSLDGIDIVALPFMGEHSDLDIRSKTTYVVRVGRKGMMFAADTCNIEPTLYEHVHNALGDIDILFLGMECVGAPLTWLYGPLLTQRLDREMDNSRRLSGSDCQQGMALVEAFGCRQVYIYAMGQEPWLNYVMSIKYTERSKPIVESNRLIQECRSKGIVSERLFGEKEMLVEV